MPKQTRPCVESASSWAFETTGSKMQEKFLSFCARLAAGIFAYICSRETFSVSVCVCVCVCVCVKSLRSCLTLCDPMDCSPPGSSVPGILQARIPEWVAISSSKGSSQPRDQTHISYVSCAGWQVLYHWRHLGSPPANYTPIKNLKIKNIKQKN